MGNVFKITIEDSNVGCNKIEFYVNDCALIEILDGNYFNQKFVDARVNKETTFKEIIEEKVFDKEVVG